MEKKTKTNRVKVEANFLLVIAITTLVALALNFIALIIHAAGGSEQAAEVFDALSFPAGVASIVFTILNFTMWKVVRDQTKVNYHYVTVGYIIPLAISVALGLALAIVWGNANTVQAHVIIHSVSLPIDLFTCIYSFILESKIRKNI